MNKKKDFDCVEMKLSIQENMYNQFNASSYKDYFKKMEKYIKESPLIHNLKDKSRLIHSA